MATIKALATAVAALCALAPEATVLRGQEESAATANPIRKVVTLLQNIQKKIQEEGKKEEEAYNKYMCYCQKNGGELTEEIEAAKAKIDATGAAIKQGAESKEQTEASLKEHQASREEAKETMAKASALREKEAAAYAKVKAEYDTNLAALSKAITAIENGMAGAFLQTTASAVVRRYIMEKAVMPDATREEVLTFLSGAQSSGYMPQAGEVVGLLKQIEEDMAKNLAAETEQEDAAAVNFEALMKAKKKEVAALQTQIEEEMTRAGDLGVKVAGLQNDLGDTKASLSADTKFQLDLKQNCDTKSEEWEKIKATRAEELVAVAETIKALNDDDALDLFRKTLPATTASFVQLKANRQAVAARALGAVLKAAAGQQHPQLDLIAFALKGKKVGFEKVLKMIDEMVANLKREQTDDDGKREYCNVQLDGADDKRKELEISISNAETTIEEAQGAVAQLSEEMKALEAGLRALDKAVAEATELRKGEREEYSELIVSNGKAKKILEWAKNRLNKFYNPKLYKAPAKKELSAKEPAKLLQLARDEPPEAPEGFGPYRSKSQESGGVIAMLNLLVRDLDKETQEAGVVEKAAQADYEKVMRESAEKRAADSKALTQKAAMKADAEESLQAASESKTATTKDLMSTAKYIKSLHEECDWLLRYYEARKDARASEMDALANAKAVLSGADFSLLQRPAAFLARH